MTKTILHNRGRCQFVGNKQKRIIIQQRISFQCLYTIMSTATTKSLLLSPEESLWRACQFGRFAAAEAAIAGGACVNQSHGTSTPLSYAVYEHYEPLVALLLRHGADPNSFGVMYHGARNSTARILRLLLDAGGDVNGCTIGSKLPLWWAFLDSRHDIVEVLLKHPRLNLANDIQELARQRCVLDKMVAREVARRAALTASEHRAWTVSESYASMRRLHMAGLADKLCAPSVSAVLRSMRFVWITHFATSVGSLS